MRIPRRGVVRGGVDALVMVVPRCGAAESGIRVRVVGTVESFTPLSGRNPPTITATAPPGPEIPPSGQDQPDPGHPRRNTGP
jgi:hypothetical protein